MTPDLRFEFEANAERSLITIRREFAAKRQIVWDCHTKSELLDQWFAPKPFTTKTKSMEFREGGHWHYAMVDPAGPEHWCWLDYITISPIENYTAKDGFCDENGVLNRKLPRSDWDVSFSDKSAHTLVETLITYESPEDLETVIQMGMKEGMTSTLERLDELLKSINREGRRA